MHGVGSPDLISSGWWWQSQAPAGVRGGACLLRYLLWWVWGRGTLWDFRNSVFETLTSGSGAPRCCCWLAALKPQEESPAGTSPRPVRVAGRGGRAGPAWRSAAGLSLGAQKPPGQGPSPKGCAGLSSEGVGPPKRSSNSSSNPSGPGLPAGPLPSLLQVLLYTVTRCSQKAEKLQQPWQRTGQTTTRRKAAQPCDGAACRHPRVRWIDLRDIRLRGRSQTPGPWVARPRSQEISGTGSCTSSSGQAAGGLGRPPAGDRLSVWSEGMFWNEVEVAAAQHGRSAKCPVPFAFTWLMLCYVSFTPRKKPILKTPYLKNRDDRTEQD